MDPFEKFKRLNELLHPKAPQKEWNPRFCERCSGIRRRDTVYGYLVCIECGRVALRNQYYVTEFATSFCRIESQRYSRIKYFKLFLEKGHQLPTSIEDQLVRMFRRVNGEFKKIVSGRKNLIKYNYLLRKMLEELNEVEHSKAFPIPSRRRTLRKYDRIWKSICEGLDFTFRPSLST